MSHAKAAEPWLTAADLRLTEDDLPFSEELPMESDQHLFQLMLLIQTLRDYWAGRQDVYVGGNMFVYFSPRQRQDEDFRGPDFFVVRGVPERKRKSYVVWQEGKPPDVVIELISEGTARFDKVNKKRIYQNRLRVPEYFWFDPRNGEWMGYAFPDETTRFYQELKPDEQGRLVSRQLGLALVRWRGTFMNREETWLRWATLEGELLPIKEEELAQAVAEAQQERARRKQAEQRARQERRLRVLAEKRAHQAEERLAELEALLAQSRQAKKDD